MYINIQEPGYTMRICYSMSIVNSEIKKGRIFMSSLVTESSYDEVISCHQNFVIKMFNQHFSAFIVDVFLSLSIE